MPRNFIRLFVVIFGIKIVTGNRAASSVALWFEPARFDPVEAYLNMTGITMGHNLEFSTQKHVTHYAL